MRVKRLGGGFGGKAGMQCGRARNVALIAANKLKRPVSCVLTRYEDMVNTGGRHPALAYYKYVMYTMFYLSFPLLYNYKDFFTTSALPISLYKHPNFFCY